MECSASKDYFMTAVNVGRENKKGADSKSFGLDCTSQKAWIMWQDKQEEETRSAVLLPVSGDMWYLHPSR